MRFLVLLPLVAMALVVGCASGSAAAPVATPSAPQPLVTAAVTPATNAAAPAAPKSAPMATAVKPNSAADATPDAATAKPPASDQTVPVGQWQTIAPDAKVRVLSLAVADLYDFGCHRQPADPGTHFYLLQAEGSFAGSANDPYLFDAANWHVVGADGQEDVAGTVFSFEGFGFNVAEDGGTKGEVVFLASGIAGLYYQAEPGGAKTWFAVPSPD